MTYLDKPWLKSYKLGPYKLEETLAPYPHDPVFKALDDAAANYPGQTAILFKERSINYRQLKTRVDRLAAALAGLGVKRGDRVCVFLPNCVEFILSDWAILKAGAAIVPTSALRTDEGLVHEAGSSNSRVIICREEHLERVLGVREQCDIEHIIVTSTAGYDVEEVSGPLPKGVYELRALLDGHEPVPPQVDIDPMEDLCELAFTGGATGVPKGVMVTHANRYSCMLQGLPWILKPILRGFVGKASALVAIPLFHAYGHYIHQSAAQLGLRVILLPDPRDTKTLVEHVQRYRPFLIPVVPTQLMRMAEADVSRMNVLLMSGSAPLPLEVAQAIKDKIGMPISQGYGLTETSPLTHFNISAFSKVTGFMLQEKVGIGIPSPDTECKLVDGETGEEVPFGEAGEIVVRGPQIMKGYWPEAGSGLTDDGWLHTGDIGVMDDDGYFQIVDRSKDMVNISGLKVYTTHVDDVLYRHPGVVAAAAFGVPDPKIPGSERVMAAIQLKEEYRGKVTAEEITDFCGQHLAPYAVPRFVEFRDDLPLTVTEKIFKRALRDEAIARMKEGREMPYRRLGSELVCATPSKVCRMSCPPSEFASSWILDAGPSKGLCKGQVQEVSPIRGTFPFDPMGGEEMPVYRYCTPEWLQISAESYRSNRRFQQALAKLTLKIFFNVKAEPAWGIDRDLIFGAFVKEGELEELAFFSEEDTKVEAEFLLAATPQGWKKILRKQSKFVTDFVLGRIVLEQGSKVGVLGIAHHADTFVDALTQVELQFPDEMTAEELDDFRAYVAQFRRELGV